MALDRFYNQDEVLSKQPTDGQIFDNADQSLLDGGANFVRLNASDITGINGITQINVEKHYYAGSSLVASEVGQGLETLGNDAEGYTIYVSPESDLRSAGFKSGTYSVVYNFLHSTPSVKITEISGDRTEVRLGSVDGSQGALEAFEALFLKNSNVQAPNSLITPNDRYAPLLLNLGQNNLIPVINAKFNGQIQGEVTDFLPYPVGDEPGSIFFPVEDRALESALDDNNETAYQTFAEVKIDRNTSFAGNPTPHFEMTGRFDEFKIVQNPDTTLRWDRKFSLGTITNSGSLPQDVTQEMIRSAVERAGNWNGGSPGGGVVVGLQQPHNWSVRYQRISYEILSTDEAIIKLYNPLPDNIQVNDTVGLDAQLQKSYIDRVILFDQLGEDQTPFFSDPNFNIDLGENKGATTEFETWESLLDAGTSTQQKIIDKFFSGSLGNVKLNIDYSNFKNFVNFSSAVERVENFYYKLQRVEAFNRRIGVLNNVSGSEALTNITSSARRRDNLIGGFDDFEYWLYYNHDAQIYSHYSSSDFTINPYPKSNRNPDTLYHSTSSQGLNWKAATLASASLYDAQNSNTLSDIIPVNLADDELNAEYKIFVDMLGQHFDISWNYIKSLTDINVREEHPKDGLSNDLIDIIAESFGWKLFNGYSDTGLWQYEFGINQSGNPIQSGSLYSKPTKEIVQETWRRLVNNLPGIYKTKGTARSFKTLISSYGIPSSFLKIREYGGPRVIEDKNIYEHERYVYKLQLDGKNRGSHIWDTINGFRPKTIEYVGKLPKDDHTIFRLNQKDGGQIDLHWDWNNVTRQARLRLKGGSPVIQISSSYFPYRNQRDVVIGFSSASGGYTLDAAFVDDFGEILHHATASTTDNNWNYIWNSSGSSDENKFMSPFTGTNLSGVTNTSTASIQEIRYYKKKLSGEVIDGHAKNREAYYSDDNTTDLDIDTSFENVLYRIFPDSTFNNVSGSISSIHPNQEFTSSDRGFILSASFQHGHPQHLSGEVDTQYVTIPSVGALNLSNNKVRIESSSLQGPLQFDRSNELSQYDQAPLDSNLLGTYFSTTDTVNFDIYASEGYFSVDDLIGDTDVRNIDGYDLLDFRARNYFQKYNRGTALNILIGMLSRYDMSVFDTMKQLVPARADWHKGILIEPHVFERNNYKTPDNIDFTQHQFSSNGVSVVSSVTGSYLTYTSSIPQNPFNPSVYKYTNILRFSSSGDYFTDTNPYWEYSPTGSTVLDARLSLSALEPKYFYSNSVSASLGITFANSASFHFARIQDDRLTGGLENLFFKGCRITSDSLTTKSPDTPDNTPVVQITSVDPDILVNNTDGLESSDEVSGGVTKPVIENDLLDLVMITKPLETIDEQNSGKGDAVQDAGMVFRPIPLGPPVIPTVTLGTGQSTVSQPRPIIRPSVPRPVILVPDRVGRPSATSIDSNALNRQIGLTQRRQQRPPSAGGNFNPFSNSDNPIRRNIRESKPRFPGG